MRCRASRSGPCAARSHRADRRVLTRHAAATGDATQSATPRARLEIRPVRFAEACAFVDAHHRHHTAPRGHKYSIGDPDEDGALVGVAIVGRPVARHLDDGYTLEVTRLATLGVPTACTRLYSAAWKAARAIGYRRMITYTQGGEHGASLRASGWHKVRDLPSRSGGNSATRPREDRGSDHIARVLWQAGAPAPTCTSPTEPPRGGRRC